jgi:tetratricopeptide (TPR) repeat protein
MRVLRYWRLGLGAALVSGVLGVGAALAQPAVPTYPECTKKPLPQDNEAAKNAHKVATEFYDRGDYDKAIRSWNDAFGFDCTVNPLLINIANAYEKKGDRAAAVATLDEYLKRTGPNPTIQTKIQNLKAAMAPPPDSASAAPDASAAPTVMEPVPTASATTPPPPLVESRRPYGGAPWGLVGGGGALALVGAILLPIGYSQVNDAASKCPNHVCPVNQPNSNANINEGNTGRSEGYAGWGLLGVGLAAAGGGLIWQLAGNNPEPVQPKVGRAYAHPSDRRGRRLWVAPVTGPGQSGVVAGGSF